MRREGRNLIRQVETVSLGPFLGFCLGRPGAEHALAAGLKTTKFSSLSATITASPMSDKMEWRISLEPESSALP
jgi:hypothetical protein